jgi:hypothetical protein
MRIDETCDAASFVNVHAYGIDLRTKRRVHANILDDFLNAPQQP